MATITTLSGNEIFCLGLKNYNAGPNLFGNSVVSRGVFGALASVGSNIVGGEVVNVTEVINTARTNAFNRMLDEADEKKADGIAGVSSELRLVREHTEFTFSGSAVSGPLNGRKRWSSAGDAQELYCHMDAGYEPVTHAFGNVAYSMGVGGGLAGWGKSLGRGEIAEYSAIFNETRHLALARIEANAREFGANSVVGIRTEINNLFGVHEMSMTGTASINEALPKQTFSDPVTSDLTGEELWGESARGFAPLKLLMSTSIYSLGIASGWKSAFLAMKKGENGPLTEVMHEAREVAFDRLNREADALAAKHGLHKVEVIGTRMNIRTLSKNLIEFMTVGTAMARLRGAKVATPQLPAQAIVRDKTTFIHNGSGSIAEGPT